MKKTLLTITLLTLSGCQTNYVLDTNFDQQKIKNYFKPSQVKLVNQISETANFVGELSESRCFKQPQIQEPIYREIRTTLRKEAADLGANQLLVDLCHTKSQTDKPSCPIELRCQARAFIEQD